MKFCQNCNNMFYTKIEDKKLIFYCKGCNFNREFDKSIDDCDIYSTSYNTDSESYREKINKYTHLDPTLPRLTTMTCPNDTCVSHSQPDLNEVIYIKYNLDKMNFIYLCCNCKTSWKSDS